MCGFHNQRHVFALLETLPITLTPVSQALIVTTLLVSGMNHRLLATVSKPPAEYTDACIEEARCFDLIVASKHSLSNWYFTKNYANLNHMKCDKSWKCLKRCGRTLVRRNLQARVVVSRTTMRRSCDWSKECNTEVDCKFEIR